MRRGVLLEAATEGAMPPRPQLPGSYGPPVMPLRWQLGAFGPWVDVGWTYAFGQPLPVLGQAARDEMRRYVLGH